MDPKLIFLGFIYFVMDTLIYIFAGIGVLATVIALYYFIKDQYAIWEMNTYDRLKKKFDW